MISNKQLLVLIGISLFVGLASLTPKPPKSAGAPAERTGAPTIFTARENTCNISSCHGDFALNSGNGILTIECVDCDGQYKAGSENTIRVSLKAAGFDKYGFQAVVLRVDSIYNFPVGETEVMDGVRTQILSANNQSDWMKDRRYITHTYDGNVAIAADTTSWDFKWIAPDNYTDTVTVYVAAVSADNDLEMAGDYVYTAELSMTGMLVGISPGADHLELSIFPNPTSNTLFISSPNNVGLMKFRLFNLGGEEVYSAMVEANKEIAWDKDAIQSGLYMYSLTNNQVMLKQGKIAIQ